MKTRFSVVAIIFSLFLVISCNTQVKEKDKKSEMKVENKLKDPLPSWNEGAVKQKIIDFVNTVTDPSNPDYVKPAERIATFDNDGTLWVEYPMYTQFLFAFDRLKELAPQHPEWKSQQPFKGALEGDMKAVMATGMKGLMEILMVTHAGMTPDEFSKEVFNWLTMTEHPKFKRPYTECIYQPQLELMQYLRANEFKTFIVSGGGIAFMRAITEDIYGVPPEQVVGSSIAAEFQVKDGKAEIIRQPKIFFVDDKATKPIGIYQHIGRRPILAFGNSDSDIQVIQYTMAGSGLRMGLFVHHTDGDNEFAYDRKSHVGTLDKVLDEADANGWLIVDMKTDWNRIFPFSK